MKYSLVTLNPEDFRIDDSEFTFDYVMKVAKVISSSDSLEEALKSMISDINNGFISDEYFYVLVDRELKTIIYKQSK